jgi:hypothetical protein
MCITLHVSSVKRSSSEVPHRTYSLQFLCLCPSYWNIWRCTDQETLNNTRVLEDVTLSFKANICPWHYYTQNSLQYKQLKKSIRSLLLQHIQRNSYAWKQQTFPMNVENRFRIYLRADGATYNSYIYVISIYINSCFSMTFMNKFREQQMQELFKVIIV